MRRDRGWRMTGVLLPVLILAVAASVGSSSRVPTLFGGLASAADDDPGASAQLEPNQRVLRPDRDLASMGIEAVGVGNAAPYAAVADGDSLALSDDTSYVSVASGVRRAVHRVGVTRAPSGNVTHLSVHYRAAATAAPVTVTIRAYDRDRLITQGMPHRLEPSQGWVNLVDDLGELTISSAAGLQIETEFDSGVDGVASGRYSALFATVSLSVSLSFGPTGSQGGGVMTAVALPPGDTGTVLIGTDGAGLYRSTDSGHTFVARNGSMKERAWLRIAGLAYHPTRPGVVYAVAGSGEDDSSMHRSTDDGETWNLVTGQPQFSARTNEETLAGQPRSVGNLLAFADDPGTGATTIWAATYRQGVMRSDDDGASWKAVGLDGLFLRGLAQHPTSPDILYVGTLGSGTWVSTNARARVVIFTQVSGGPDTSEEVVFVGDTLYVAGGTHGIYRLEGSSLVGANTGVPLGVAN
jgi:hypothetical protein